MRKSEEDKKRWKDKESYHSYVILHNDNLEIIRELNGLFFKGHASPLIVNFSDIVSLDKIENTFFNTVLIKTDKSDFGRTIQLSMVKKDDCKGLMEMFDDYKEEHDVVEEDNNNLDSNGGSVDELLKYADLYREGLLTLEEFEKVKKKIIL